MKSRKRSDDEINRHGLTLKRVGKSIHWSVRRTREEYAFFKRRLWESRTPTIANIRTSVDELTGLIQKYSSFDLVANLWLRNGVFNPETYREWDAPQRPHFIEYAALLELKSKEYRITPQLVVEAADVARAHELMEGILRNTMWYHVARNADPRSKPESEALRKAEFFGMLRYMVVGPPAHAQHWSDVLDGILGGADLQATLKQTLGISYSEIRLLADAVGSSMVTKVADRLQAARHHQVKLEADLARYMSSGKYDGAEDAKAVLDRFRNMRAKERKRSIQFMMLSWACVALPDQLSFTAEDLATCAGTSIEAATRFLNIVQTDLGSTPKGFLLPSPKHSLHRRPVVKLEANWFCPVPYRLLWAIKPAIEEELQKHSCWEAYQTRRASFLVDQTLRYFERILPQALCADSLFYPIGDGQEAELDALVVFDRYAYLIEAKAGGRSRATKADSFKARLEEVVGDATRQALRAREYIQRSECPRFRRSDGSKLQIDKSQVTDLIPVTVSLDSLDVFTSELNELRSILNIPCAIWAVCLTDLREIVEIISRPSEFTHYLRWRLSVGSREDVVGDRDELNWLGIYLKNGPIPPTPPQGFDLLAFSSHTEDFDSYFMHKLGYRDKQAPRPAQHLPNPLPALLEGIERTGFTRFTEVAEALLDCTFAERDKLAQSLNELAFLSMKGRGESVIVENERWVFRMCSVQLPPDGLASVCAETARSRIKPTILLAADPRDRWRVFGWHIERI